MNTRLTLLVTSLAVCLGGCFQSPADKLAEAAKKMEQAAKPMEQAAKKIEEAGKQMEQAQKSGDMAAIGDAMKQMGAAFGGAQGELVDFRELRAMLPESLPGMKRTGVEGSKGGAMGFGASTAKGEYEAEGNVQQRMTIEITDIGALGGLAGAAFAWAGVEVDKENKDGYEKTTSIGGRKAMEKFSKSSKRGELDVIVGNRFVVSVKGSNIEMATFKDTIGKLDLAKLEKMAPAKAATAQK